MTRRMARLREKSSQSRAEGEAEGCEFTPCKKYMPPPRGCVFKKGDKGLGMYRDCRRVAIALADLVGPASGLAPIQLRLDTILPEKVEPKWCLAAAWAGGWW